MCTEKSGNDLKAKKTKACLKGTKVFLFVSDGWAWEVDLLIFEKYIMNNRFKVYMYSLCV